MSVIGSHKTYKLALIMGFHICAEVSFDFQKDWEVFIERDSLKAKKIFQCFEKRIKSLCLITQGAISKLQEADSSPSLVVVL